MSARNPDSPVGLPLGISEMCGGVGKVAVALGIGLCLACAPKSDRGLQVTSSADAALEAHKERAATASNQQALDNLRLASVALARGDQDLAEEALRRASSIMTTFRADGEFRAAVGAEQAKDWKGEPYEKMAAFLTLGLLLHAEGDRGNALAMYKSAVLADTGTAEERYRSDFVPGWLMQALAYQAEREQGNAEQAMGRAVDAWWSRHTAEVLSESLVATSVSSLSSARTEQAKLLLSEAMSAGLARAPRDPREAAEATIAFAPDLARVQRDRRRKERLTAFRRMSPKDFGQALEDLGPVAEAWMEQVGLQPDVAAVRGQAFARRMEDLLEDEPKVVLLIEAGRGPTKIRMGEYGEILTIQPGESPGTPVVQLDGAGLAAVRLDSLSYQATTRGSRRVDGFLKGKAVYKDTSLITGYVLLRTAELAAWSDNDELALITAVVGGTLFVSGAVTNPRADVRQWREVPEAWYLVTADPEPGSHTLDVAGRSYTLEVPERGQLVQHITALPPYGSDTVGPRP